MIYGDGERYETSYLWLDPLDRRLWWLDTKPHKGILLLAHIWGRIP